MVNFGLILNDETIVWTCREIFQRLKFFTKL